MAYTKNSTWQNKPVLTTPISAARLNHMEDGIWEASRQVAIGGTDAPTWTHPSIWFRDAGDGVAELWIQE